MARGLDFMCQTHFKLTEAATKNSKVNINAFFYAYSDENQATWACKACNKPYKYHAVTMKDHLRRCTLHQELQKTHRTAGSIPRTTNAFKSKQTELIVHRVSAAKKKELDKQFAKACITSGLPFTVYEHDDMKAAFHSLNPAYKPPNRKAIAGRLLDQVYHDVQTEVDRFLKQTELYNIITDESTNINNARIQNISIHTSVGSFFWKSEDIGDLSLTAANLANWLRTKLLELTNGRLDLINSIATDTCPTMLAVWVTLARFPDLKHCFFIPCDSHGMQLLIKDLLQLPCFQTILDRAQAIVKAFRNAPLQYSRLRTYQLLKYGERRALCLSVITRWGTQFQLVESVINNKAALREYLNHFDEVPVEIRESIRSNEFWIRLDMLKEVLEPIDDAIKMSESDKSHLGYVISRWASIRTHLVRMQTDFPSLEEFLTPDTGSFALRFKRQVNDIHLVATYLTPANHKLQLNANEEHQIFLFFEKYTSSETESAKAREEFRDFRKQRNVFAPDRFCWKEKDNPKAFWDGQSSHTQSLGDIAYRIFSTPANSVPSERAFSTQNFIHTKTRNALHTTRVDKLVYTYMNSRILSKIAATGKQSVDSDVPPQESQITGSNFQLSNEEEVELEDILMNDESMGEEEELEDIQGE